MVFTRRQIQATFLAFGCLIVYYICNFNFTRKLGFFSNKEDLIADYDNAQDDEYDKASSTEVNNFCDCNSEDIEVQNFIRGFSTRCPMIITTAGRLGSMMGQYASLYALARLNGRAAYMLESMSERLKKYFDLSMPVMDREIAARINWKTKWVDDWMRNEYSNIKCDFVIVAGIPTSRTFFRNVTVQIKKEFIFKFDIISDCQKQLRKYRGTKKSVTFIGIHVRRSEYVDLMKGVYKGVLPDADYFDEAMDYFRNKYSDSVFVICSDDLNWCEKNINSSRSDVFFGWDGLSSDSGRDLALLVQCNHTIMSVGSFSFWAAYLTGGEVIYFGNFTHPNSKFGEIFQYATAYLPEWRRINANLSSTGWY